MWNTLRNKFDQLIKDTDLGKGHYKLVAIGLYAVAHAIMQTSGSIDRCAEALDNISTAIDKHHN